MTEPEPDPIESIIPELTVDPDGVGRCTIRGAARIVGISAQSLSESLASSVSLNPTKLTVMLMSRGFDGVRIAGFAQDGIPDRALAIIVEYYAFDEVIADLNQATCTLFLLCSTGAGFTIRVGIQDFEPSSNSIRTIGQFALCSTIVPVRPLGTQTRSLI